jgi:topoisomerase-4 subunit A
VTRAASEHLGRQGPGEIEEFTNPKAKAGKKSLTPDQQNLKSAALALLETARDDSDGEHTGAPRCSSRAPARSSPRS